MVGPVFLVNRHFILLDNQHVQVAGTVHRVVQVKESVLVTASCGSERRALYVFVTLESMGTETSSVCQPGHENCPPSKMGLCSLLHQKMVPVSTRLALAEPWDLLLWMKCSKDGGMPVLSLASRGILSSLRTPHPWEEPGLACWTRGGHRSRHGHPTEATMVQPQRQPGNSVQTQGMATRITTQQNRAQTASAQNTKRNKCLFENGL